MFLAVAFGGSANATLAQESRIDPRLNEIQVIGTHNSYHIAPHENLMKLIGLARKDAAESLDYTHRPLEEQFSKLGVRQIELDLYADPNGGLFAQPIGRKMLKESSQEAGPDPNRENCLEAPGLKIIHAPGFDFASTVPTLIVALNEVLHWSNAHQNHIPVMILLELKESTTGPAGVKAIPFDQSMLDAVDAEIRSVFHDSRIIKPDDLRANRATLREAILESGWPRLSECRGKVLFALDNEGGLRDRYLEGHPNLEGRIMFASVSESHPAAAWMKINEPIADFERIVAMVKKGFLVRTRADANTLQARSNDPTQRDKAFASGAQFISTDYPEPDRRWSEYAVRFPGNRVARTNPVNGDPTAREIELE